VATGATADRAGADGLGSGLGLALGDEEARGDGLDELRARRCTVSRTISVRTSGAD